MDRILAKQPRFNSAIDHFWVFSFLYWADHAFPPRSQLFDDYRCSGHPGWLDDPVVPETASLQPSAPGDCCDRCINRDLSA